MMIINFLSFIFDINFIVMLSTNWFTFNIILYFRGRLLRNISGRVVTYLSKNVFSFLIVKVLREEIRVLNGLALLISKLFLFLLLHFLIHALVIQMLSQLFNVFLVYLFWWLWTLQNFRFLIFLHIIVYFQVLRTSGSAQFGFFFFCFFNLL